MPVWHIHHPTTLWSSADKSALANAISDWYHHGIGLPRFYAIVIFYPHEPVDFYRGGLAVTSETSSSTGTSSSPSSASDTSNSNSLSTAGTTTAFVRIEMSHIARTSDPDPARAAKVQKDFDDILKPYVFDRGVGVEYNYRNDERAFWRVDGLVPPPGGSEAEDLWKKENRAVPY